MIQPSHITGHVPTAQQVIEFVRCQRAGLPADPDLLAQVGRIVIGPSPELAGSAPEPEGGATAQEPEPA